ncbi:Hypothetical predicted protein [Paramuricea clavata]|uniref:Uncharacterized protein n=1 Tax=Paramuricea clavata TaxID=317549 RepID=A0A7D9HCU1_PARCT|nr:Hypothetical predicted protein [Paramuricea clavata]
MTSKGKPPETEVEVQGQINSPMEWTKRRDTMLFREVLVVNPYQANKKTVQRGQLWQTVAANLVQLEEPVFKCSLSKRSVQDRCTLLCEKHKKRMKYEMKASGISPQVTELDNLIGDIGERGGERRVEGNTRHKPLSFFLGEAQKKKVEQDQRNAVDIRKKAMERFGETKKRKIDEGEIEEKKRKRRSGSDTLQFVMEQSENEMNTREKELVLEKEKQTREEQRHNDFKEMMAQQMAQQQQQMAQFQMMFMQQNNLMLSILEKKS